jgi:hypothetical protein
VPLRAAPVLAATANATVPFPDPEAPLEIVIHGTLDVAAQAQPLFAVTPTLPFPPLASTAWLVGEIA